MITLTTDFGLRDPFVGMMKGAVLSINPGAVIVDITHGIRPQDIMGAALAIGDSYHYFPPGTVHVAVVDPGVGSRRMPILAESAGHLFVGPDNGVFTWALDSSGGPERVRHIKEKRYFLKEGGPTFHGRDVFAPVAAWLSRGARPGDFGPQVSGWTRLPLPEAEVSETGVEGEVVLMDRFGNAITNIMEKDVSRLLERGDLKVRVRDRELDMRSHYAEAGDRRPHALINSSGRLEVFVYMGSAAEELGMETGDRVSVAVSS